MPFRPSLDFAGRLASAFSKGVETLLASNIKEMAQPIKRHGAAGEMLSKQLMIACRGCGNGFFDSGKPAFAPKEPAPVRRD
jgi:hypothetical protein